MKIEFKDGHIRTQLEPEIFIHYVETCPEPDSPIVLFLHGFPESSHTWKDYQLSMASSGFHTVALDLRGYNTSSSPQATDQYRLDLLVRDIEMVLKHFKKKAFLVGHDWGGIITWKVAEQSSDLLYGAVIVNAPRPGTFMKNFGPKQALKS